MSESAAFSRRSFGKTAKPTTLAGSIDNATTTITLVDGSTYPDGSLGPFMITLDSGLTSEERVEVATRSGNSLTGCVRGADGTTPLAHATTVNGVTHTSTTRDFDEANKLVNAMAVNSVRVRNSGALIIPNNTSTTLTFDTERWDGNTMHSTSVNTSRLTCKQAGKYLVYGHVSWAVNGVGVRDARIILNGASILAAQAGAATSLSTERVNLTVSTVYDLALNDFVELSVVQDSGGALTVDAVANYSPEFGMNFIGL